MLVVILTAWLTMPANAQGFEDVLEDPSIISSIAVLASGVAALLVNGVLFLLWTYFRIKIGVEHRKALMEGATTWAENAVMKGVRVANQEAAEDLKDYLTKSYPQAMKFHKPALIILGRIAQRVLNKAQGPAQGTLPLNR